MIRILLFSIVAFVTLQAKSCMTDIYFGNGVWNTQKQAIYSKNELRNLMLFKAPTRLDIQKERSDYTFKYAYNPSYGKIDDLIETFWQLRESGQISDGYFVAVSAALSGTSDPNKLLKKLREIISQYNADVLTMESLYLNSSFTKKHNVLLVAHSQGNLFGNKMYEDMPDKYRTKFRMVSVATPADHVMKSGQTSPYVTASGDPVIGSIPKALPGNVDGLGHTFIGTYLNSSINAPRKIALYVKNAYDRLMKTTSCTEYWALSMTLHTEGYMEVFAYPVLGGYNSSIPTSLGTVDFHPYPLKIERDSQGNIVKQCDVDPDIVKWWGDTSLCWANSPDGTCEWKPGEIYDKSTLEARKNLHIVMMSQDHTQCINISHGGDLYKLTKDIFE